jgi:hypothetical protein
MFTTLIPAKDIGVNRIDAKVRLEAALRNAPLSVIDSLPSVPSSLFSWMSQKGKFGTCFQ